MSKSGKDENYHLTVGDYLKLQEDIAELKTDMREIKEELKGKNTIVVDNSYRTDWKAISAIITAVIAATILTINQIFGNKS